MPPMPLLGPGSNGIADLALQSLLVYHSVNRGDNIASNMAYLQCSRVSFLQPMSCLVQYDLVQRLCTAHLQHDTCSDMQPRQYYTEKATEAGHRQGTQAAPHTKEQSQTNPKLPQQL